MFRRLSTTIAFSLLASLNGIAHAQVPAASSHLTVYACQGNRLIQRQVVHTSLESSASLIRTGQAIWSSGAIDDSTVEAIAEGRGIWSAAPVTTLAQITGLQIPPEILTAIAIKESGVKGRFWPWTINLNGQSIYLETRQKAIDTAKRLLSQGIKNFDVSLMQVNWRWNGHRFASIESAFDPVVNLRVASQILSEHHKSTGTWQAAIARYHSRSSSLGQRYVADVLDQVGRINKPVLGSAEKRLC